MNHILINDEKIMGIVDDACKLLDSDIENYTIYGSELNGIYITAQDVIDLFPALVDEIKYYKNKSESYEYKIDELETEIEELKDRVKFYETPFGEDEDYDECQIEY